MKVTLTSGAEIEMRGSNELTARDKAAMYEATVMPSPMAVDPSGGPRPRTTVTLGMLEAQTYAVLASIIISWTYPYPLPKDDASVDLDGYPSWDESLKMLPLDDWNELEEAIAPHLVKLRGGGPKVNVTPGTSSTSSGTSKARAGSSRPGSRRTS